MKLGIKLWNFSGWCVLNRIGQKNNSFRDISFANQSFVFASQLLHRIFTKVTQFGSIYKRCLFYSFVKLIVCLILICLSIKNNCKIHFDEESLKKVKKSPSDHPKL